MDHFLLETEPDHSVAATHATASTADRIDRTLASLRIGPGIEEPGGNDAGDADSSESFYTYQASDVVRLMHRAPRGVGHTNRMASLLESVGKGNTNANANGTPSFSLANNDYTNGLRLFAGFFVLAPFVIWAIVLIAFKCKHCYDVFRGNNADNNPTNNNANKTGKQSSATPPTTKSSESQTAITTSNKSESETRSEIDANFTTPWIAGGSVIDMIKLSKAGVQRKHRKRLVLQSWRIQSLFLSASILIPIISVVMMEFGWKPLEEAVRELQDLNGDVETLAYRGWDAMQRLESSKQELFSENELVRSVVEYSDSKAKGYEPDRKPLTDMNRDGGDTYGSNNDKNNNRSLQNKPFAAKQKQKQKETQTVPPTQLPEIPSDISPWSDMVTSSPTELQIEIYNLEDAPVGGDAWKDKSEYLLKTMEKGKALPPTTPQNNGVVDNSSREEEEEEINNESVLLLDDFFLSEPASSTLSTQSLPSSSALPVVDTPQLKGGGLIEEWCPDAPRYIGEEEMAFWASSIDSLSQNTETIDRIFNSLETSFPYTEENKETPSSSRSDNGDNPEKQTHGSSAFRWVIEATNAVNEAIEWFFANDWLLKLLVVVLNVVNGLLLANVYFVSKNNIIHAPTRCYVAYFLVPLFAVAAVLVLVVAVATSVAVLVSADFCSGGTSGSGSPQGTMEDFVSTLQHRLNQNIEGGPNDPLDLLYDSVDYFWTGCLSENPLQFLDDFSNDVDAAAAKLNQITMLLPDTGVATVTASSSALQPELIAEGNQTDANSGSYINPFASATLERLNKACDRDMSFLPPAISDLDHHVDGIKTNIHKLSDIMSCGQVSPLLLTVSQGAMCVELPHGLTVLWGCSFGIVALCFALLTVRAALYNSVKYKKRRPTKPRRVVEKEFKEYKEYMRQYYGEQTTEKWNIDGESLPPTKLEFDFDIEMESTFDSSSPISGTLSNSNLEGSSEIGGFHEQNNADDGDSSYGSSYDSEISDDENSIDSDQEQGSAIGSLLSDTRSIAMQTMHSLRNVTSLLSSTVKKNTSRLRDYSIRSPQHQGSVGSNCYDGFGASPAAKGMGADSNVAPVVVVPEDDSITEDSLYLPTPVSDCVIDPEMTSPCHNRRDQTHETTNLLRFDDSYSDEEGTNEEEEELQIRSAIRLASDRLKQALTPSNLISTLSPSAPRKSFPFMARTLYNNLEGGRSKTTNRNSTDDEEFTALVQPMQLANLTPFRDQRKHQGS
ncbi:unnamed protein product [Pseudo-nitzschia multistriata]|uniref:Transmembrane protein n=1 Tax=Pseudo-nitzschia multistriata TaxID=183589 RepID=A0A448ZG54_9STRA|nr:unnamed protein product [Pseudo-nitzschia multistriata]